MFLGSPISHWKQSVFWGVYALLGGIFYLYLRTFSLSLSTFNSSATFAGMVLINMSFALSGTSYFWNLGKSYLGYRKPLGVVGFGFAILHILVSTYMYSENFSTLTYFTSNPIPFIFSLHAFVILTMMVIVSNFGIPARIGGIVWRQLLRIGYIAILFIIIHATLLSAPAWKNWFTTFKPILPPLSSITVLMSWTTIFLRIALWYALRRNERQPQKENPSRSGTIID